MPAIAVDRAYNASDGLSIAFGDSAVVEALKRHAVSLLAASRSWDGVTFRSAQAASRADMRPATMLREVPFDYSLDQSGRYVEFVEVGDDDCNISW